MKAPIIDKQINNQKNHDVLSDRDRVWNVSIEAAHFYPLLGIGNGNWHRISLEDLKKSTEERGVPFDPENYRLDVDHSHSLYLSSLVERGVIGFIILVIFMGAWLKTLIKSYNKLKTSTQGCYIWGGL